MKKILSIFFALFLVMVLAPQAQAYKGGHHYKYGHRSGGFHHRAHRGHHGYYKGSYYPYKHHHRYSYGYKSRHYKGYGYYPYESGKYYGHGHHGKGHNGYGISYNTPRYHGSYLYGY